jgi:CheY-like chemotaxis protein
VGALPERERAETCRVGTPVDKVARVEKRIVMVVEDDHLIRQVIAEALEEEGFEVLEAANGKEALEALRQVHPSLILLDLMMPVMNGWEFRRAQLEDPTLADIPVVVLSALKDHTVEAERSFTKPFDLEDLLDTVWDFAGAP